MMSLIWKCLVRLLLLLRLGIIAMIVTGERFWTAFAEEEEADNDTVLL